jgi:hypothetical protein
MGASATDRHAWTYSGHACSLISSAIDRHETLKTCAHHAIRAAWHLIGWAIAEHRLPCTQEQGSYGFIGISMQSTTVDCDRHVGLAIKQSHEHRGTLKERRRYTLPA